MAGVIKGKNDIGTLYPNLLKEWDYAKNKKLQPEDFSFGSNKKVWWICSKCGNEWEAIISSRTHGTGCPICGRKKQGTSFRDGRLKKIGSLKETNPELCEEWNYEKNWNMLPEQFTHGSNKKVWWICPKGHEWEATISSRAKGCGCSKCNAGYRVSLPEKAIVFYLKKGKIDVQENARIFGSSLRDVDIFLPEYNCAIEYDGEHWHKIKHKDLEKAQLCKERGIKLIRIREPKAGLLEDGYSIEHLTEPPKNDLEYINESIKWLLEYLNIKIQSKVDSNRDMSSIRSMIERSYDEDSFGKVYPEIASEWDDKKNGSLTPFDVSKCSGLKIWWRCKLGHSWQDSVAHRISDRGCPYCSGHRTLTGFNDFKTRHPDIAKEWDYEKNTSISPDKISSCNGRKAWWICPKGHSYQATVAHRVEDGNGCPICANQKVLFGYNDLLTNNAKVAEEWNYKRNGSLTPEKMLVGSNKKVWWKCASCGNEWRAQISTRTKNGAGCPVCKRRKGGIEHHKTALANNGSIKEKCPELALEWHPYKNGTNIPDNFTIGSREEVWWKCSKCGNEWIARIANRAILGRSCPRCAIAERIKKKNKAVVCIETKEQFESLNAASIFANVSPSKIGACCRGKQKTAGGYHWKFV